MVDWLHVDVRLVFDCVGLIVDLFAIVVRLICYDLLFLFNCINACSWWF